jgi:hypothetical protein
MNKKESKTAETKKEPSSVRSYFTPEINNQIVEMSLKEMEVILKEMISSRQWVAILKYVNTRSILLESQLRTTNPTADPHSISWAQGAMAGIYDLENYIIDINAEKPSSEEDENTNYEPEGKV